MIENVFTGERKRAFVQMYQHLAGARVGRLECFHRGRKSAGGIVYSGFVLLGNVYGCHCLGEDARKGDWRGMGVF